MNTALLTINYVATALVVLFCFRTRPLKLLDPAWAFIGGYFINYCIRPTLFLIDPELGSAYGGMFNNDVILRGFSVTMVFALVGLMGFALGNLSYSSASRKVSRMLPSPDAGKILKSKSLPWIAFALLVCGWWGMHGFIAAVGWTGSLLLLLQGGQRGEFTAAILGNGLFTFAAQLSLVGWGLICAYWTAAPLPSDTRGRLIRRITQAIWFLLTAAIWVAFGERSSLLVVLFVPVALRYTLQRKLGDSGELPPAGVPVRKILIGLAAGGFLVAGPIGLAFKGIEGSPAAAISLSISAWDSFEFTVLAQRDLRFHDLAWGSTYFQDLYYTWLPRSLFPSKPERYGIMVIQDRLASELLDNEGATFPPGILVEAFANFGYVGLFLIPLIIGMFCQALYLRLYRNDVYWIVLLSFLFASLASFRGFGGFVALLMANGVVLYVVLALGRMLERLHYSLSRLQP